MKKNTKLLIIVGVLLVVIISASFAYYIARTKVTGEGSNIGGTTERMIEVEYDAKDGKLATDNMYPGVTASKDFTVTVTPGSVTNEATYVIKLNITENTFEYCTDENYNEITNACKKGEPELIYTLKDSNGNIISTGDITGKTGTIELARETKTVTERTIYTYTLEITNVETNADQNHNANKVINGEVVVEFGEKGVNAKEMILAKSKKGEGTPNFSKTSCTPGTNTSNATKNCDEATVGLYSAEDDDGITYYFRGDVEDNYVKLAGFYWRIVRINGDGSIRMIYDGTEPHSNGIITSNNFAKEQVIFNNSHENNEYLGFMYTIGEVQGNETKSNILKELEFWYIENLASYASKLDMNAGFCGDRRSNTIADAAPNGTGGTGTTFTYYGARYRLYSNKMPELSCETADFYTVSEANKGNKSLTYPIGLITADEVNMAGGVWSVENYSYYLYNGQYYWTMSPFDYRGYTGISVIWLEGKIWWESTTTHAWGYRKYGMRPVINLKSDTLFYGNGTIDNPYVVID